MLRASKPVHKNPLFWGRNLSTSIFKSIFLFYIAPWSFHRAVWWLIPTFWKKKLRKWTSSILAYTPRTKMFNLRFKVHGVKNKSLSHHELLLHYYFRGIINSVLFNGSIYTTIGIQATANGRNESFFQSINSVTWKLWLTEIFLCWYPCRWRRTHQHGIHRRFAILKK